MISGLLGLSLVVLNANLLIQLNSLHAFIPVRTQLPAFFYAVLTLGFTQMHYLSAELLASAILVFVFFRIFNTYKSESTSINFLDAGLLVSVASLIYFPAIFFLLFLFCSLIILRPFHWREWVFVFVGLLLPYFFLFSIYYLAGWSPANYLAGLSMIMERNPQHFKLSQISHLVYTLLILILGSGYMMVSIDNMKIHARKFFLVLLSFFGVSVIAYLAIPSAGIGIAYAASIPAAYLFTHYFSKCRRNWLNELLFLLFLLMLIWQRI